MGRTSAKQEGQEAQLATVCSTALTCFRDLARWLKPVLPHLAAAVEHFLDVPAFDWPKQWAALPAGHVIRPYEHLMTRIERRQIDALLAANTETLAAAAPAQAAKATKAPAPSAEAGANVIDANTFFQVDLRVARIVAAERVEGSSKLLRLELDLNEGRTRQVFSGIQSAYDPATLVGRLTVCVANLAPRKMKFGVSEAMVLCASDETQKDAGLYLLSPDSGAAPGMRIT